MTATIPALGASGASMRGIRGHRWIPAFAGMTASAKRALIAIDPTLAKQAFQAFSA